MRYGRFQKEFRNFRSSDKRTLVSVNRVVFDCRLRFRTSPAERGGSFQPKVW